MKKGISPLIATVLLIAFTIAIAVIIMRWGTDFVKNITKSTEESTEMALKCTDLKIEMSDIDCTDNKLKLTNNGNIEIKSVKFRIYAAADVEIEDYTQKIESFGVKTISLTTDLGTSVTKIEAIPVIVDPSGADHPCAEAMIQKINPCA